MSQDAADANFVQVATLSELEAEDRKLVNTQGQAIALFHHEGEVHAVDNRCPHMGFPLTEGSVDDGVLTCHWHHARFELSCGDTFDPWADDVQDYPVDVRGEDVFVDPHPEPDLPPAEHWAERLEDGMERNLRLVIAKSVIGLDDADVPYADPLTRGVDFGTRFREMGWSSGLTILGCMANSVEALDGDDRRRAMYTGLRHVASDCAGEAPNFDQPSFSVRDVPADRLRSWFRGNVEVRDSDGAERTLRTAVETCSREEVERMLFAAATDHVYLDTGHTLDFCNKAVETLDHVGWDEHAGDVLASLVDSLTDAERSEELSSWRQPADLADLLFSTYGDGPTDTWGLEALREEGAGKTWDPDADFRDTLLDDDPHAIVDALETAVRSGADPATLADAVCDAAATRVAQFATANEFSDWNTVHHTFTYANAVREAAHRIGTTELYRGVFDAATNVYLDRFLNTPAARIPAPGDSSRDPDAVLDDLLATFDREGAVDEAGKLVGEFLDCGGDVADLRAALGHALLREDAGFHTLQAYECGFQQYDRAASARARRTALVAVARYMSAHFPTRREAEQTFTIASRLHRGEKIHENA